MGDLPSNICNNKSDKKFAVPVTWINWPRANEVTISKSKLLSILLMTCLMFKTLNKSIKTTPSKDATTKGRISKAPRVTTERKIKSDLNYI